ncbi:MAG: hypothetical protein SVS85_04555, partial [Candidatus Nanohaloarchaea archaeon]|nr:hypothetical protein [Candidatus Nanohaloarchaea archaeon]
ERQELDISRFLRIVSRNIRQKGMTFEEALFDSRSGALHRYPSKLMETVMEVLVESTRKGTGVAAAALQSISKYIQNIQDTEKRLEQLLEDTISSLKFLGYVLAPVIAGVAVGMGSVISLSLHQISKVAPGGNQTATNATQGAGVGAPNIPSLFGLKSVIPPGILQLVVGFYLIELTFVLGNLLVRVEEGINPEKRNTVIGKLLASSLTFYTLVVLIVVSVFGSIITGAL